MVRLLSPLRSLEQFVLRPLDRGSIVLMLVLSTLIGGLLWRGDRTTPKVREFNWQGQEVGIADQAMIFTFSRPMDRVSVENNFRIHPPLSGKFSWAGRRMAYTLTQPIPYGTEYQVEINQAKDRFASNQPEMEQPVIHPFVGQFRSRDRAFIYLGVEGEETSAMVLYNLTKQEKRILTPPDLVVVDFEPYPTGERILFSATDRTDFEQGQFDPKLYTVTTGLNRDLTENTDHIDLSNIPPVGRIDQVLDSGNYQNLKFDLSPDGSIIIVQRANKDNPGADFGLWIIRENQAAQPLETETGGEFLITPDSNGLIMAQGQGLAILPLEDHTEPFDFLPRFGQVLNLSANGRQAAMIRFNSDFTQSLFLVTNAGIQKELWRTYGSILKAEFDPTQQILYCLVTRLIPGETYQEEPYLIAIDLTQVMADGSEQASINPTDEPLDEPLNEPLKEGLNNTDTTIEPAQSQDIPQEIQESQEINEDAVYPLLRLANQRDISVSLAPDGLALLFDQIEHQVTDNAAGPRSSDSKLVRKSRLWLLPLIPPEVLGQDVPLPEPEPLPIVGLHPRWLP